MIPQNILHPKGCKIEFDKEKFDNILCRVCGETLTNRKVDFCLNCQNIQKAQAQTLLDEKKSELEFLEQIDLRDCDSIEVITNSDDEIWLDKYLGNKIQELQEEIKVLEGVLK